MTPQSTTAEDFSSRKEWKGGVWLCLEMHGAASNVLESAAWPRMDSAMCLRLLPLPHLLHRPPPFPHKPYTTSVRRCRSLNNFTKSSKWYYQNIIQGCLAMIQKPICFMSCHPLLMTFRTQNDGMVSDLLWQKEIKPSQHRISYCQLSVIRRPSQSAAAVTIICDTSLVSDANTQTIDDHAAVPSTD
jgi:hypothetical protein